MMSDDDDYHKQVTSDDLHRFLHLIHCRRHVFRFYSDDCSGAMSPATVIKSNPPRRFQVLDAVATIAACKADGADIAAGLVRSDSGLELILASTQEIPSATEAHIREVWSNLQVLSNKLREEPDSERHADLKLTIRCKILEFCRYRFAHFCYKMEPGFGVRIEALEQFRTELLCTKDVAQSEAIDDFASGISTIVAALKPVGPRLRHGKKLEDGEWASLALEMSNAIEILRQRFLKPSLALPDPVDRLQTLINKGRPEMWLRKWLCEICSIAVSTRFLLAMAKRSSNTFSADLQVRRLLPQRRPLPRKVSETDYQKLVHSVPRSHDPEIITNSNIHDVIQTALCDTSDHSAVAVHPEVIVAMYLNDLVRNAPRQGNVDRYIGSSTWTCELCAVWLSLFENGQYTTQPTVPKWSFPWVLPDMWMTASQCLEFCTTMAARLRNELSRIGWREGYIEWTEDEAKIYLNPADEREWPDHARESRTLHADV